MPSKLTNEEALASYCRLEQTGGLIKVSVIGRTAGGSILTASLGRAMVMEERAVFQEQRSVRMSKARSVQPMTVIDMFY